MPQEISPGEVSGRGTSQNPGNAPWVDFAAVLLFAVLLKLAIKHIDERDSGVKPVIIMASSRCYEIHHNSYSPFGTWNGLFDAKVFLAIALNAAALLRFPALRVAGNSGSSGKKLHLYL